MLASILAAGRGHPRLTLLPTLLALAIAAAAAFYADAGVYGFNVVLRRGGSVWYATGPDDPALSPSMRLALRGDVPAVSAGSLNWAPLADGFEAARLPVLAEGRPVDALLLVRVDPVRFRLTVHNRPAGDREPGDWLRALGAVFVINGSYYSRRGTPDTPLKSGGVLLGPSDYDARHGALIAADGRAELRDLAREPWQEAFRGASDAMVSYPMLIGADGRSRVRADERWLANRSFVGQDRQGRIVLGTTEDAFFSLSRFAAFLREAPLDLRLALNLDGGPLACQGLMLGGQSRDACGAYETAVHDGVLKRLASVIPDRRWGLPIVLAVMPREPALAPGGPVP